jgi:OmpA-OmpF porin, OOP family
MRKMITGSLLLVVMAAAPAFADKGFSAGASVGYSNISIEEGSETLDFSAVGYKVFATYMFNDYFGVEGGWVDFGSASEYVPIVVADLELSTDGFDVFAVGAMPISDTFDLFAKAGMFSWDVSADVGGSSFGSDSGEDIAIGVGGRFNTSGGFGFRAEYEWFDIEDVDSAWLLSVGFEYAFK